MSDVMPFLKIDIQHVLKQTKLEEIPGILLLLDWKKAYFSVGLVFVLSWNISQTHSFNQLYKKLVMALIVTGECGTETMADNNNIIEKQWNIIIFLNIPLNIFPWACSPRLSLPQLVFKLWRNKKIMYNSLEHFISFNSPAAFHFY